MKLKFTQH